MLSSVGKGGSAKTVRRLLLVGSSLILFGGLSGALAWIVGDLLLGLHDEALALFVAAVGALGSGLGAGFGQPFLGAALDRTLEAPTPAFTDRETFDRSCRQLQLTINQERIQGANSQREQMVGKAPLLDLPVKRELEVRTGKDERPHLSLTGSRDNWSQVADAWIHEEGRLVLLGDPGYGKTAAALTLIARVNSETNMVAELFPLVDWHTWSIDRKRPTIEDWLADQLITTYPRISRSAVWELVLEGRLVPVFDGLDEIPRKARVKCRDAIEAYAGRDGSPRRFILTCRTKEYLDLSPQWVGAENQVALTGLSDAEIVSALEPLISRFPRWRELIEAVEAGDAHLVKLLRSPLRLSASIEVFCDRDPGELLELASSTNPTRKLWDLMLESDNHDLGGASKADARHWLSFLAASMQSHDRQRFWLHELYLYGSPVTRRRFFLASIAVFELIVVTISCLNSTASRWILTAMLFVFWFVIYMRRRDKPLGLDVHVSTRPWNYVRAIPTAGLVGLITTGIWMALGGLTVSVAYALGQIVQHWPFEPGRALGDGFTDALTAGVPMFAGVMIVSLQKVGSYSVAEEPPARLVARGPGAVISAARNNAFALALGVGIVFTLIDLVLTSSTTQRWLNVLGLVALWSWFNGVEAWAYYHWTRLDLARRGLAPRRLRRFLDTVAEETGWLRVGAAYEFRHRELLDYLAREGDPIGAENITWEAAQQRRRMPRVRQRPVPSSTADRFAAENQRRDDGLALATVADHERHIESLEGTDAGQPRSAERDAQVGMARLLAGDPLGAADLLRGAHQVDPDVIEHARALEALGQDEAAIEILNCAEEPNREITAALNSLTERHRSRMSALSAAEAAARDAPDNFVHRWQLATIQRQLTYGEKADSNRELAVDSAIRQQSEGAFWLAWKLNCCGWSSDAVAVANSIRYQTSNPGRASALAHAFADLGQTELADRNLRALERNADNAETLNSLASVLIIRGRWGDARLAINQALKRGASEIHFAFTYAEVELASGDLNSARKAISEALGEAKKEGQPPGDPAWMCRILWQYAAFARRELAVEMLIEEYEHHGFGEDLRRGLIAATPTSSRQTGWNLAALPTWFAEWGRHERMLSGVGVLQMLAAPPFGTRPVA